MCVTMLYVSFGSKVRPRLCGCVVMGSAVLLILRFILLVYSIGSGVNRVLVGMSGFSVRLLCFVHEKLYVGMVVYIFCLYSCLCMLM